MKVLLATGIYPPDIGGPATYVRHLAGELTAKGMGVRVVTYSDSKEMDMKRLNDPWKVVGVPRSGGPLMRWWRFAKALKEHGSDADVIYAFSSVSCGVPLRLARLKKPKTVLRLGGDFLWERYTDLGGKKTLRVWHHSYLIPFAPLRLLELWILRAFHHIVFSTHFQEEILAKHFRYLPSHSVIENALPEPDDHLQAHIPHDPFKLLFMGRYVGFKNLMRLLLAVSKLPWVTLTLVGDGPMKKKLRNFSRTRGLDSRVKFRDIVHGAEKKEVFDEHDLLILPSITEISPNVALEARAHGLPVLLSSETGLSPILTRGMVLMPMLSAVQITQAIQKTVAEYAHVADDAASPPTVRTWEAVAAEHVSLFQNLR